MPVREHLHVVESNRVVAFNAQLEHYPVREVDQVLVDHRMAAEDRRLPVVYAVDVRARVVEIVVVLPLGGASGAHVAVAGRGQRLAQPLFGRVEALVGERETVHQASRSIRATTAWAGD